MSSLAISPFHIEQAPPWMVCLSLKMTKSTSAFLLFLNVCTSTVALFYRLWTTKTHAFCRLWTIQEYDGTKMHQPQTIYNLEIATYFPNRPVIHIQIRHRSPINPKALTTETKNASTQASNGNIIITPTPISTRPKHPHHEPLSSEFSAVCFWP